MRSLALRALLTLGASGLLVLAPGQAHASDLAEDVARVYGAWSAAASRVTRLSPRFLFPGQSLPVQLPERAARPDAQGCSTVAILGPRTSSFAAQLGPGRRQESAHKSASGLLTLSRCGPSRADLAELAVRLASGRATLEFIIAEGSQVAPELEQLLPERQPGPAGTLGDVGHPPEVEPVASRIAQMERRIIASGGQLAARRTLRPGPNGGGTRVVEISTGCHRFVLLPDTSPGRPADLDAELRDRHDRVSVRDRSNATDAVLDTCAGEATSMELSWLASNRIAPVILLQGTWPLPAGIPLEWGARARAALGSSLRKRTSPSLPNPPQWEATGLPGRTSVAVELAPDACYVVGIAPARGDLRSVALAVTAGVASHHDTGGGGHESAVVAFCARGARIANVEIDASGQGLLWVTGLWKTGRLTPGAAEAW